MPYNATARSAALWQLEMRCLFFLHPAWAKVKQVHMDIQKMIAYLDRLEGDVHLLLPRLFAKAGKKTVHDFRVGVKRLRAFFALSEGVLEAFSAQEGEAVLQPVYKRAGRVRHWQLIYQTLRKLERAYALSDKWSSRAKQEVRAAQAQLKELAPDFNLIPLRETCAAAKSRWAHVEPAALSYRLDHHWDAAVQQLHGWCQQYERSARAWHEARRALKSLIYQLEVLHVAAPQVALPSELRQSLHAYQDLLGKWHDAWQIWTTLIKQGLDEALLAEQLESRLDKRTDKARRFFEAWPQLREALRAIGKEYAHAARHTRTRPRKGGKKKARPLRASVFPKNLDDLLR